MAEIRSGRLTATRPKAVRTSPTGAFVFKPRFPGQIYDSESNLHYDYS